LEYQKFLQEERERELDAERAAGTRKIARSEDEIAKIRKAQFITSTSIHPDTGEVIAWPCRFSSFIPMNIPIAFGFICAAPTPFNTILW
jgi:hypothetical protein